MLPSLASLLGAGDPMGVKEAAPHMEDGPNSDNVWNTCAIPSGSRQGLVNDTVSTTKATTPRQLNQLGTVNVESYESCIQFRKTWASESPRATLSTSNITLRD